MELQKGTLFHDRYILVTQLGTGASAQVWKAKDTKANNLIVALKIFSQNSGMDSYGLQNFEKEFTTVYNMKQTNLLPPTGYDIFHGMPYLVMQYCENGSCNSMVGRAEEEDIIKLLHDVSAGLEYLHDHNIIHQDIKPDNILLDDNCNFLVTDFGISVSTKGSVYDSNGMSGGTLAYMGPERFEGKTVPASDIWSLGATAVELLTGNPPFGEHGGLLQAQGEKMLELPDKLQPEVKGIILSCLSDDPSCRIKSNEIRQKIELYWETGSWIKHSPKKTIAIVATAVASVLMCLGIFMWDYNRTKVYYYKDYVECWGIPEGIGRVAPWTAKHMQRIYKFEFRQGKVRRISHVNSFGKVIADEESERNERPINQDIYYSSEGKVSRIKVRDNNDRVLYVKAFNENLSTMSFQYDDQHNTERAISSSTVGYSRLLEDDNVHKGKITRWLINYDNDGRAISIKYATLDNSDACDDNNIYGRTMTYDENGHIIELHYVGKDGNPQPTKWGLGVKKFYYDEADNWVKSEYLTIDGKPSYDDADGVSIYELEYDKYGNVIASFHKDGDGKYMLPKKNGLAGSVREYDEHGLITKETFLGIDKEPIFVPSIGCAGYTAKYDENGFEVEREFFDPDGNICETSQGHSKITFANDNKGNQIETWVYDMTGALCLNSEGFAGTVSRYDSLGNVSEVVYYGKDKRPILNEKGEAGLRMKYDDRNLMIELLTLGKDMKPAYDNNNVCLAKYQYDKRGNMTQIAFYNESGNKMVLSGEHVAGWNIVYDDLGNELERSFFDANSTPCAVTGGYSKKTTTYDQNGHIKSERYFNTSNNLTVVDGIAGVDYVCDDRGNIIVEKPISPSGQLAQGYLEVHYKYDKFDNCIEKSFFDSGKTAYCLDGYHKMLQTYNSRNLLTELAYYNSDSKLCLTHTEGIAKLRYEYDSRGNRIKTFYYGVDEKPIVGVEGWASSTYEYDAFGNIIKQCFFGRDGNPTDPRIMVPVGICSYDIHNNVVFLAGQDGHGNYIINPNTGWAIMRMTYDNKSHILSKSYYNDKDRPMNGEDGYHKITYIYDVNGNNTEEAYYDINDKPALVNGIHKIRTTYDDNGNITTYAFYNKADNPTDGSSGCHKIVISYENGVPCSRKFYTVNGTLLASQTYNIARNEWNEMQGTSVSATASYWRETISMANEECPMEVDDGVVLQSLTISNNTIIVKLKLTELSKYNMDDETLKGIKQACMKIESELRRTLDVPANVNIQLIIVDKADRKI